MDRLHRGFRKMDINERRRQVAEVFRLDERDFFASKGSSDTQALADTMIESAIGIMPVPLGLATGFTIDGDSYDIPFATEEPSVVAAATYAASIVGESGFETWATEPIMLAQIFLSSGSLLLKRSSKLCSKHNWPLCSGAAAATAGSEQPGWQAAVCCRWMCTSMCGMLWAPICSIQRPKQRSCFWNVSAAAGLS